MSFRENFRQGREQVRAARGETTPLYVARPVHRETHALEVARPVEPPSLDEAELRRLEQEIERLQRLCSAQGQRYPGCPLDLIAAESALIGAITVTFSVGRWLLGLSPEQRERRRAALSRAAERAAARQKQWEAAAREQPRVRITHVAKRASPADSSAKRPP